MGTWLLPEEANEKFVLKFRASRGIRGNYARPASTVKPVRPNFIHALKETIHPITAAIRKNPIAISGEISSRYQEESADAGQLLAEHYIQHSGSANLRLHQHHTWVIGDHLSDDGGIPAKWVLLHLPKYGWRHLRHNQGQ